MVQIKSVAIAGATGTLGPHVLKALVDANFDVTILTRSKNPDAYDGGAKVVEVDFASVEALTAALQGIDGLVSTVGTAAAGEVQNNLIDAAVAAGVKRFIPSEYGTCTTNPKLETLPVYAPMFKTRQYLQGKTKEGQLTWTVLACGAFLDFLFHGSIFLDYVNKKATLYDEGDNRISATALPNIGTAIAGIFKNFEATKNKVVKTSEVILTQNKLLKIAETLRPDAKWDISKVQTSAILKEGLDGLAAGDFSMPTILKVIAGTAFAGDVYEAAYDVTDNELLGVKELAEEDLKKLVAKNLA